MKLRNRLALLALAMTAVSAMTGAVTYQSIGWLSRSNSGEPIPKGPLDLGRAMGQGVPIYTAIGSANADVYAKATPGGSTQAVFPYGAVTVGKMTAEGTCCWTSYDDATLGNQGAETATALTAGGATGGCIGYQFEAGEAHDMICELEQMQGRVGFTGRYCTGWVRSNHGAPVHPPCNDDTACSNLGAGTCAAAGGGHDNGSCRLVCSATGAGAIKTNPER